MGIDYRGVYTPENIDSSIKMALPQNVLKDNAFFNFDLLNGVPQFGPSPENTEVSDVLKSAVRVAYALYQANQFALEMSYYFASHLETLNKEGNITIKSDNFKDIEEAHKYFKKFCEHLEGLTQVWCNNIRDFYYPAYEDEKNRRRKTE